MRRFIRGVCLASLFVGGMAGQALAQKALTWDEVKSRFEASNPILRAGQIAIGESKANEITAYLRPNPNFTALLDQVDPFPANPSRPLAQALPSGALTCLQERQDKRELRRDSAQKAADREYRHTELNYFNFLGFYLIAAGQLSLAGGREVLQ